MGIPGRIFICYRRDDSPGDARGVRDLLSQKFGKANVFMDIDNLLAGQRFDRELDKALAQCEVLIAIIGPRWMNLLTEHARSDERDFVHDEIAGALKREIVVIPTLVGRKGHMPALPRRDDLPPAIRDLVLHQQQDVAHESFRRDATELSVAIKAVMGDRWAPSPWRKIAGAAATVLVVTAASVGYWTGMIPGVGPNIRRENPAMDAAKIAATSNSDTARKDADAEARRKVDAKAADEAARKKADEVRLAEAKVADARKAEAEEAKRKAEADARRKAQADTKAAEYAAAECDRLAASPYDDDRPAGVAGILDVARIDVTATAACDDAMRSYPVVARFYYQAGRAVAGRSDNSRAAGLFREAVAKGSVAALADLASLYVRGVGGPQNYLVAHSLYEKGAARGSSAAITGLGELAESGQGVPQDYTAARGFYEQAAALGNANAMYHLGEFYNYAHGVQRDPAEMRKWYQMAAEHGHVRAMADLASFLEQGELGPRDVVQARNWYEKAAGLGDARAMTNLATFYYQGRFVSQDYAVARTWFEKAAALGNNYAMFNLGIIYENGRGVAKDPEQARKWFQKAADAGNENAKTKLRNSR